MKHQKQAFVILAIGSNHDQKEHIDLAQLRLRELFYGQISFTQFIWTAPIGMDSDPFLNGLATATTALSLPELQQALKDIEHEAGAHERGSTVINLDIDILQYGSQRLHQKDWERPYIQQLLSMVERNNEINDQEHHN